MLDARTQATNIDTQINTQVQIAITAISDLEEARLLIQCKEDNATFPMYLEVI